MKTGRRRPTVKACSNGLVRVRPDGANGLLLAALAILVTLSSEAGAQEIGDLVWEDLDGDGYQEWPETGLLGADVRLLDCNNVEIASTTTDSDGIYRFRD